MSDKEFWDMEHCDKCGYFFRLTGRCSCSTKGEQSCARPKIKRYFCERPSAMRVASGVGDAFFVSAADFDRLRGELDAMNRNLNATEQECARYRQLLQTIVYDRVTHWEGPVRWVRLYPEDEEQAARLLRTADREVVKP